MTVIEEQVGHQEPAPTMELPAATSTEVELLADDGSELQTVPPLPPKMAITRAIAISALVALAGLTFQIVVLSHFQQSASQTVKFAEFREGIELGTGPTTGVDADGDLLEVGTPIARLQIPDIGLDQIVVEGTSSGALFNGPGHRRDTVFPGQIGTSVVMGRKGSYGAPFAKIESLEPGDEIEVTTAQGIFEYSVTGVRRAGDPLPERLPAGAGRLSLVTASGARYVPNGIITVDAELAAGAAVQGARPPIALGGIPESEQPLAGDTSNLLVLALWLQALILVAVASIWSMYRWGRAATWIVAVPVFTFVGLGAAGEIVRLLPNLL